MARSKASIGEKISDAGRRVMEAVASPGNPEVDQTSDEPGKADASPANPEGNRKWGDPEEGDPRTRIEYHENDPTFAKSIHPLCYGTPEADGEEYEGLKKDIRTYGKLSTPIVVFKGQVVEGRTRFLACKDAEVMPNPRLPLGDVLDKEDDLITEQDIKDYVYRTNMLRKHFSKSQLAVAAARHYVTAEKPEDWKNVDVSDLAEKAGVSVGTMQSCVKVMRKASPMLIDAAYAGKVSVSDVEKVLSANKAKQEKALAKFLKDKETNGKATLKTALDKLNGGNGDTSDGNDPNKPKNAIVLSEQGRRSVASIKKQLGNLLGTKQLDVESAWYADVKSADGKGGAIIICAGENYPQNFAKLLRDSL